MIIRELFIDEKKCTGNGACQCDPPCYDAYPDLFAEIQGPAGEHTKKAKVIVEQVPPEKKDQAEWAIFRCWEQTGTGAGSILGRGEPDVPEP